jgi:hypothetical protein
LLLVALAVGKVAVFILQTGDVFYNVGDGFMVLHHLLMMAPALIGRSGFDCLTNQNIDFDNPANRSFSLKELHMRREEGLIFEVLLE